MSVLRTISALSRPARLPTVWSNCLAGWWLGGGGNGLALPFVFTGAALLYTGWAFLNDAFDADFDRQHQPLRPIPSGAVSLQIVFRVGLASLIGGALLLFAAGMVTGGCGIVLAFLIIGYTATHRLLPFSPVLRGLCRFLFYLIGAAAAERGITGWSIWCGLALGVYVAGFGFLARWEDKPHQALYWPVCLLVFPILLAMIMNAAGYRQPALLLSLMLSLWMLRSLRQTFWSIDRSMERTISGLMGGMVFVDWLGVAPVAAVGSTSGFAPREVSLAFILLFLSTLAAQKLAPEK